MSCAMRSCPGSSRRRAHACSGPRYFARRDVAAAVVAALVILSGCKKTTAKETRSEREAEALSAVKLPGYNLFDNQTAATSFVRVARAGQATASAVLTASDTALAPGLACTPGDLSLEFQSQGNKAVTGSDTIKIQSRKVASCQPLRNFLADKRKTQPGAGSALLSALDDTLNRLTGFELAILKFEGGLPSGGPVKWAPVKSYDESLSLTSERSEWRKWETLTGKFTAIIGFNKEETTPGGTFSRRIWLPTRLPANQSSTSPLEFAAETWIVDSARSPIRDTQEWLKGPAQFLFPAFLVSGVSRFPNVTPDGEIQSPAPRLLAFVHKWTENSEAPDSMRFAPQCLDAAPVLALLK